MRYCITRVFCSLLLAAASLSGYPAAAEDLRVPVSKFLSPELLQGTGYTLHDEAVIRRSVATFTLDTPAGTTTVVGSMSLRERINEIQAVATLEEMEKSDVYMDALKKSGRAPIDFAKGLVTSPVDTVSNTAKGIGGWFADIGYSVVSNDPSQENAAKTALGYATAKRKFAFELGVNPYSSYEPLQDHLGEVSWTAVGGGLTVSAGFRAVKGGAGQALTLSKTANGMRGLVRDKSPRELQKINLEKLAAMGVQEDLAEAFLNNHYFDPEAETRIVGALDSMKGVAGRGDVVALASLASSRGRASTLRDAIELIEVYHSEVKPAKSLIVVSSAPFIVTADQQVQAVLPVDYTASTPEVEQRTRAISEKLQARKLTLGSIWVSGEVESDMTSFLKSLGWQEVTAHAGSSGS